MYHAGLALGPQSWPETSEGADKNLPGLWSEETIDHRVEAAVAVCQAGGDRKDVSVDGIESTVPGHQVKPYQNFPESDYMVGKPAEGEGRRKPPGYRQSGLPLGCPDAVVACIVAAAVERPTAAGSWWL